MKVCCTLPSRQRKQMGVSKLLGVFAAMLGIDNVGQGLVGLSRQPHHEQQRLLTRALATESCILFSLGVLAIVCRCSLAAPSFCCVLFSYACRLGVNRCWPGWA
jgi:hypothetical protein